MSLPGYPKLYDELPGQGKKALWPKRWATSIARKAGLRRAALFDAGADIMGTFSRITGDDGFAFSAGAFPEGDTMMRAADLTGITEARLLANVSVAGTGALSVTGAFTASVPLTGEGVIFSDWVEIDGSAALQYSASGGASVGLVQLQVR